MTLPELFDRASEREAQSDHDDAPEVFFGEHAELAEEASSYMHGRLRQAVADTGSDIAYDFRSLVPLFQRGMDGYGSRMSMEGRTYFLGLFAQLRNLCDALDPAPAPAPEAQTAEGPGT